VKTDSSLVERHRVETTTFNGEFTLKITADKLTFSCRFRRHKISTLKNIRVSGDVILVPLPKFCVVSDEPQLSFGSKNAMKFSKPRSFVEVHLSVEAGLALVDVRDFGLGIPPGAEDTVFGRFTQVDATDTKAVYGSGLGMHISKQLMVRHGGNIHYVSELGVGTTFTITVPVTPETLT